MKKGILGILSGLALVSMSAVSFAGAIEGGAVWFSEDAASFAENAHEKWGYSEGAAVRSGNRITLAASDDLGEVNYLPEMTVSGHRIVIENTMSFTYVSGLPTSVDRDLAAISIVDDGASGCVFAVLDPSDKTGWRQTTFAATLNTDYLVRIDLNYDVRTITYSCRANALDSWQEVYTAAMPANAVYPTEFAFSGAGSLTKMAAEYKQDKPSDMDVWSYATGLMTWQGTGAATATVAIDNAAAKFQQLKKNEADGAWYDGETYVGSKSYTSFPGYSGAATPFANAFKYGETGYKEPGLALRFKPNDGTLAGKVGGGTTPFALAGLLVESGATGYGIAQTGTLAVKLGDPTGVKGGRFEIHEDFAMTRTGGETRFYGDNTLAIAEDCTFDLNSGVSSSTVYLDSPTHARLALTGSGDLKVATLMATGNVTLAFSPRCVDAACIKGKLTVGDATGLEFPAELAENVALKLCSGTLTVASGSSKKVNKEISVGGEKFFALVSYTTTASPRYLKYSRATTTTDATYVAPGATYEIEGSATSLTLTKITGQVTVDGTLVVNGYCNFSNTKGVSGTGRILFDARMLEGQTGNKILLAQFYKAPDPRLFGFINNDGWTTLVDGKNVYAIRRDYTPWLADSALFAWVEGGAYDQVDPASANLTGLRLYANVESEEIPGQEGTPIAPWKMWSASNNYLAPGYALQFTAQYPGAVDLGVTDLALGGLVVEPNATNVSLVATAANSTTRFGDTEGRVETAYEFNESFTLARNGAVSFCGPTRVTVESGKTLDLNSKYASQAVTLLENATLAMAGAGTMKVGTLMATGAVTLDFGSLASSRSTPYINGNLKVDASTKFKFPADVGSYKLCSGTLTATGADGMKMIQVGDTAFYANLTFNADTKTVSWTQAKVNRATISEDVNWTSIVWEDGAFDYSLPAEITLKANARIAFTSAISAIQALHFNGPYTARLAYQVTPTIKALSFAGGAAYEIAIPVTSNFAKATDPLTVPAGLTYIIEGYTTSSVRSWTGALTVAGTLKTTGTLTLSNGENKTIDGGRLVVESGTATISGDFNTTDVYGKLTLGGTWTQAEGDQLNIAVGGSVTSSSLAGSQLTFTGPSKIGFIGKGGSATLSATCVFGDMAQSIEFFVAGSVTGVVASATMTDELQANFVKTGDGQLLYSRADIVPAGDLIIKAGEFAFAKGSPDIDFTNDGVVRVLNGVTLKTTAETLGQAIIEVGGNLILRISEEDSVYGYVAAGVTLAGGQNIVFEFPDGSQRTGTGNTLSGSAVFWTDKTGDHRWATTGNWSTARVPGLQDVVIFPIAAQVILGTEAVAGQVYVRAPVTFNCTSAGQLTAQIIRCNDKGSLVKTGVADLTLMGPLGTKDDPFMGDVAISAGTLAFGATGSWITGNVSGKGNVVVKDGVRATMLGENTYTGTTEVGNYGAWAMASGNLGATSALIGPETASVQFNNLTIGEDFTFSSKVGSSSTWKGYVWLRECTLDNADLSVFLPIKTVKFTSVTGSFKRNGTYPGTVVLQDEDNKIALDVTGGATGRHYQFEEIAGSGTVGATSAIPGFQLAFAAATNFYGSINIDGVRNMLGVYFSDVADGKHQGGYFIAPNRRIQASEGTRWYTSGKIGIESGAIFDALGTIGGTLSGEGTIQLSRQTKIESDMSDFVGDDWTGMVKLVNWQDISADTQLQHYGSERSKVGFANCEGELKGTLLDFEMVLCESDLGSAFTVTKGWDDEDVVVRKVSGDGVFKASHMTGSATQTWYFRDVADVTGGFVIEDGSALSFVLGDGERSDVFDGCLNYSKDVQVKATGKSSAPNVVMNDRIVIDGKEGQTITKVTGKLTGEFDDVEVLSVDPTSRTSYGLKLDGDSRNLNIYLKSTPPTMNIDDVRFVYGSDMTNATVVVKISNYWSGVNYSGGTWALVSVRDGDGTVIGVVGGRIRGDGMYELGPLTLFGGGRDYYFEVRVEAFETDISDPTEIRSTISVDASAHAVGSWIDENAATFASTKVAEKTGDWSWGQFADASVTNGTIRVTAGSVAEEAVIFDAYTRLTNDIVEVDVTMTPDGGFDEETLVAGSAKAALVFMNDESAHMDFGGLNPATRTFERLFIASSAGRPKAEVTYPGRVTFNYREGTVAYSINGIALTNAEGRAFFPMDADFKARGESIGAVKFIGNGNVVSVTGRDRNCRIAQVGDEEYDSLDEAVLAAQQSGTAVKLLWDASWRPVTNDVGKTIVFDEAGHKLVVDGRANNTLERQGYRLVNKGDGSYTIDVVTYRITFTKNHDDWGNEDADFYQEYSATNSVLKLLDNRFARVHFDFDHWNEVADGSGTANWSDGEEIDMTGYGFTNLTLFAQWKVAARKIIVEPADLGIYIEDVTTNGVENTAITFFGQGAETGDRSAMFEAEDGSDLVIHFTTDIEKSLDRANYIRRQPGETGQTIKYDDLPKVLGTTGSLIVKSALENWALNKGITRSALAASKYANASCALDVDTLLTDSTKVEISGFTVNGRSCTFRVTFNGKPAGNDKAAIAAIVYVTEDLAAGWQNIDEDDVTVDPETGLVTVTTATKGTFIRIVIPRD